MYIDIKQTVIQIYLFIEGTSQFQSQKTIHKNKSMYLLFYTCNTELHCFKNCYSQYLIYIQ